MKQDDTCRVFTTLLHRRLRGLIAINSLKRGNMDSSDIRVHGTDLKLATYRKIQKVLTEEGYEACMKYLEELLELLHSWIDRFVELYGIDTPDNNAFSYYVAQSDMLITVRSLIEEFTYEDGKRENDKGRQLQDGCGDEAVVE